MYSKITLLVQQLLSFQNQPESIIITNHVDMSNFSEENSSFQTSCEKI